MEEEKIKIVLFDGTTINAKSNGNCYITTDDLSETTLNDVNLISFTINDENFAHYYCTNFWHDKDEIWFVLWEKTPKQLKEEKTQSQIDFLLSLQGLKIDEEKINYYKKMGYYNEETITRLNN